jgi:excisionase family DNA binding protein
MNRKYKILCTVPQAARRLTISDKSAWRMVYSGRFEVVRIGRCVRVTEESVEDVVDEGTTPIHKDDDD